MSVIIDSQPGDELICVSEFSGPPMDVERSSQTSRTFHIGERVRYVRFLRDEHYQTFPGLGWNVVFDAADGKRYTATQTYFVTEECWEGLKKHFAKQRPKALSAKKTKNVPPRTRGRKKQPVASNTKKRRIA